MIKSFLIVILIFITGCTISIDTNIARTLKVSMPYYLHFKNNSPSEKSTIKIVNITSTRENIIYETTSGQIEERHNKGIFKISGKYYVLVSFPERKPSSEIRNDFLVKGSEKRIEIALNIRSAP